MNSAGTTFVVKAGAAVLIVWALLLHGSFLASAGALWRDEANSVNQAEAPSWSALWESLRYDSFPVLYPAVIRVLISGPPPLTDRRLRIFGVAVGVAILVSLWLAARELGSPLPVVALALLAIDPVFVAEGDSVRPYGIGLLCLLWSYCAFGRLLVKPTAAWLLTASAASILAVQTSYTNAMFIGVLGLSVAAVMLSQRTPRMIWRLFFPAFLAALSLVPYTGILRQARSWISALHSRVDWARYWESYVSSYSIAFAVAWLLMILLGLYCLARLYKIRRSEKVTLDPISIYASVAALGGVFIQIIFVEIMGVPPFPRYFLPGLLLAALALDLLTRGLRPWIRVTAALLVLLITAWPSWRWVKQRHTNVDIVARILGGNVTPSDLIIISPWFLHTSFQMYYRGSAPWLTVPDLPRQPVTRYDLILEAMSDPQREERLDGRIRQTLAGGGTIWFVSQVYPIPPADMKLPELPLKSGPAAGDDYVRFRSYWERAIVRRLYACCEPKAYQMPQDAPVWVEERLVLTCWRPTPSSRVNK